MRFLVFLEHHEGKLQKDSLGVLSKAASLGGEVEAVLLGSDVNELAGEAGKYGAQRVHVDDDVLLDKPLPQPRVDALETLLGGQQFDAVLFASSAHQPFSESMSSRAMSAIGVSTTASKKSINHT